MKNNYNSIYKSSIKEDDEKPVIEETAPVEEPAVEAEEVVEDIKIEEPKKEEKKTEVKANKDKFGRVTGGLSLNVRVEPNGTILNTLSPGEKVTIKNEKGDWYEISSPIAGYVMKKFIEII